MLGGRNSLNPATFQAPIFPAGQVVESAALEKNPELAEAQEEIRELVELQREEVLETLEAGRLEAREQHEESLAAQLAVQQAVTELKDVLVRLAQPTNADGDAQRISMVTTA